MDTQHPSLEALQDIKRMMERSSRFISLSGLSGLSAGICGLMGAYLAHGWMKVNPPEGQTYSALKTKLIWLAVGVLLASIASAFYFTWQKAQKSKLPIWDHSSKKLLINMAIPLATGGLFVAELLYQNEVKLVVPSCLVFYGLTLVNASKFTLTDIRYLGILEIILGLICMFYTDDGLYFWAAGFGLLHIIYGLFMWRKYDQGAGIHSGLVERK